MKFFVLFFGFFICLLLICKSQNSIFVINYDSKGYLELHFLDRDTTKWIYITIYCLGTPSKEGRRIVCIDTSVNPVLVPIPKYGKDYWSFGGGIHNYIIGITNRKGRKVKSYIKLKYYENLQDWVVICPSYLFLSSYEPRPATKSIY